MFKGSDHVGQGSFSHSIYIVYPIHYEAYKLAQGLGLEHNVAFLSYLSDIEQSPRYIQENVNVKNYIVPP